MHLLLIFSPKLLEESVADASDFFFQNFGDKSGNFEPFFMCSFTAERRRRRKNCLTFLAGAIILRRVDCLLAQETFTGL